MKFGLLTLFDHYAEDCTEEQYYKNFFEEVSYAEELGFDSIWLGEHHFCRYVCPAPQIVAAAVAQRTKKLRIGTAIVLLPHHDPIRLAEDYALVDLLSGGRLDFGVGAVLSRRPMMASINQWMRAAIGLTKAWN
ncbi:MAG: LLM class flavin-dependent oxidoreductase [Deltaproteobacteria bacterium]|nr:LLM class flavin-dependent oxidoreductase [Deltaproteobacteria bacterium]